MDTTIVSKPSLLEEFQSLLKLITDGNPLTCHGITRRNKRCKSRVGRAAKKRLSALSLDVIECFNNGRDGFEILLREASSLAMCIRNHQFQAIDKYETWMGMIPLTTDEISLDDSKATSTHSVPVASSSEYLPLTSYDENTLEDPDQTSNNLHRPISPTSSFEDSGYISADDDTPIKPLPRDPFSKKQAAQGFVTLKKNSEIRAQRLPPRTPQRPPLPASADSGISLTIDSFDDSKRGNVEPVSPLAYKGKQRNPFWQQFQLRQQAAAQTQHNALQKTTCVGSCKPKHRGPTFVPFNNPAKKLAQYIESPFTCEKLDMGYIYVFQTKGTTSNKIGHVTKRENEPTLEASYNKRMKEHKRCGWEPETVFRCKVLHADRVEQIIHYHLERLRQKETNLCKGPGGAKCKHSTHTEWFKAPLHEIVVVAKAWIHWMSTKPYIESTGIFKLKPEWLEKLAKVQIDHDNDIWLHWLNCHSPKKQDRADDPIKNEIPSINISTIQDIPWRLKPSKTWPIGPGSTDKY